MVLLFKGRGETRRRRKKRRVWEYFLIFLFLPFFFLGQEMPH